MTTHRHRRAGFTLVELMVGLTAGAILLSSVWVLSSASSRSFFRESQIATTQSALRLAGEQVRRDMARAGFLGHPNTQLVQTGCPPADGIQFSAVQLDAGEETGGINRVRNDELWLMGNYATEERYLARKSTSLGAVRFDIHDDAFRRSFFRPDGGGRYLFSTEAFGKAFVPGRMVRIEVYTPVRRIFFRTITSAASDDDGTNARVNLRSPLPPGCVDQSNLTNAFIAPVSRIHYAILDRDSGLLDDALYERLTRDDGSGGTRGARMDSALVRREVAIDGDLGDDEQTFLDGLERVVLEYAVEFRVHGLYCNKPNALCNASELLLLDQDDRDVAPDTAPAASQLQGLRFRLGVRTSRRDSRLPHHARGEATNPLLTWDLSGELEQTDDGDPIYDTARVRTAVFDVALPNNAR